jgi:3-oxoacyl-[acyl-carrier-protein] synthase III
VEMLGNQGCAGIGTTLCAGIEQHEDDLEDGDLMLMTVFGAGFAGGSVLLRWTDRREQPTAIGRVAARAAQ